VIDDRGRRVAELRPALLDEFAALSRDMVGFWRTQTISAAVELGVFDRLPAAAEDLTGALGLVPSRAARLLRALAELNLVDVEADLWRITPRGAYLRRDHPLTLADAAVEYAHHFTPMWTGLPRAFHDGESWRAPDVFGAVSADPERVLGHHRMLRSYARHDYEAVPGALGLRGDELVIDAGGGLGVLAGMLLERYRDVRVLLLDRQEVVDQVEPSPATVDRLEVRAWDLFEPWPASGDAVILSRVLHDRDDERAERLLRNARNALANRGRVFVVEMVLPEEGNTGALCDLHC
jgi:hypothetical protein